MIAVERLICENMALICENMPLSLPPSGSAGEYLMAHRHEVVLQANG